MYCPAPRGRACVAGYGGGQFYQEEQPRVCVRTLIYHVQSHAPTQIKLAA